MPIRFTLAIVHSFKLALQIQDSPDFNRLLLANYMAHSDGVSMKAYAQREMDLLDKGVYGVEDFHTKVDAYLDYLREVVA